MTLVTHGEGQHEDGDTVNVVLRHDEHIWRSRRVSIGGTRCLILRRRPTSFRGTVSVVVSMCVLGIMSPVFGQTAPTRDERITLLRSRIVAMSSLSQKIELEHTLAYLWNLGTPYGLLPLPAHRTQRGGEKGSGTFFSALPATGTA